MKVIILMRDVSLREKIAEYLQSFGPEPKIVPIISVAGMEEKLFREPSALVISDLSHGNKEMGLITQLKRHNPQMKVILYLSFSMLNEQLEVAFRGWEVAERVIFKELGFEGLQHGLKVEIDKLTHTSRAKDVLTLQSQSEIFLVKCDDLLFIEKFNRQLIFHLANRQITTHGTLKELTNQLPDYFYRSHRSYIINLQKIKRIIPQGRSFMVDFHGIKEKAILSYDRQKDLVDQFLL